VWTTGSYDPSLNLLFWGTGGPIPHTELVRGSGDGAVLYTDSTLALDADTGKIVWHHQFLPRDNWNLDHVFEQILVDINVGNRPRQALLAIGKPGIIWALDRRTGEFLWARETTHQTVFKSIDPETGKVTINESLIPTQLEQNQVVCPSFYGGKLWMATAYNPASKTLFLPLNICAWTTRRSSKSRWSAKTTGAAACNFVTLPQITETWAASTPSTLKTEKRYGRNSGVRTGPVHCWSRPEESSSAVTRTVASRHSMLVPERCSGSCR